MVMDGNGIDQVSDYDPVGCMMWKVLCKPLYNHKTTAF